MNNLQKLIIQRNGHRETVARQLQRFEEEVETLGVESLTALHTMVEKKSNILKGLDDKILEKTEIEEMEEEMVQTGDYTTELMMELARFRKVIRDMRLRQAGDVRSRQEDDSTSSKEQDRSLRHEEEETSTRHEEEETSTRHEEETSTRHEEDKSTRQEEETSTRHVEDKSTRQEEETSTRHVEDKSTRQEETSTRHEEDKSTRHEEETSTRHEEDKSTRHEEETSTRHEEEASSIHEGEMSSRHEEETSSRHEEETSSRHEEDRIPEGMEWRAAVRSVEQSVGENRCNSSPGEMLQIVTFLIKHAQYLHMNYQHIH